MGHAILLESIRRHIQLRPEEEQHFLALLTERTLKRKQFLLHEGQVARQVAFVTGGCLRAYAIDKQGNENVLQFAPAGWWITDMRSYIEETESILQIDALEDSEMLLLSRKDQLQLFNAIPLFERFFRIITEKSLVSSRMRLLDSLTLSAQERYLNFCSYYPTLIHTLPQKQIASFIGVTPEFLSKMKKETVKNGSPGN